MPINLGFLGQGAYINLYTDDPTILLTAMDGRRTDESEEHSV